MRFRIVQLFCDRRYVRWLMIWLDDELIKFFVTTIRFDHLIFDFIGGCAC